MAPEDIHKVLVLQSAFEGAVNCAREDVKPLIENSQVQEWSNAEGGNVTPNNGTIEGATNRTFAEVQSSNNLSVFKTSITPTANNAANASVVNPKVVFVSNVKNSSNELFYISLDKLNNLALDYANGDILRANMLTLQFIRRDKYYTPNWDEVAGEIDYGFISYVTSSKPELVAFFNRDLIFTDPSGNAIDFAHFAATLNGLVYYTRSPRSFVVGEKHIDNLVGWAGDIQTFITDDVRMATSNSSDYSLVYQAAYNLFGGQNTTFSISNLFADTDAVNISKQLSLSSLGSAFRSYYSDGEYKIRMIHFVQGITGDTTINKETLNSLVGTYTSKYWAMGIEWPLLRGANVSLNESIAIRDAFTDYIWDMVEMERKKLLHEI